MQAFLLRLMIWFESFSLARGQGVWWIATDWGIEEEREQESKISVGASDREKSSYRIIELHMQHFLLPFMLLQVASKMCYVWFMRRPSQSAHYAWASEKRLNSLHIMIDYQSSAIHIKPSNGMCKKAVFSKSCARQKVSGSCDLVKWDR